jgi:hypothetical protein
MEGIIMPLLPNASVKTKVDFTRSRFEWKRQFQVSPTANIIEEGSLLQRITSPAGSDEVVTLSTNGAALRPVGISLQSRITAVTFTAVQDIVVPTVAPFTVQLAHTTLVNITGFGESALWDYDLAVPGPLAPIAPPGPPVANVSVVVDPNGLLTFDAAQAGEHIRITYKYVLTSIERDELLRQSHVNRGAEDQFGLMTVAVGHCFVYTTMYLCTETYVVGAPLTLDNNGLFSLSGATAFGRVISLPTPSDPYLGVEYVTLV